MTMDFLISLLSVSASSSNENFLYYVSREQSDQKLKRNQIYVYFLFSFHYL